MTNKRFWDIINNSIGLKNEIKYTIIRRLDMDTNIVSTVNHLIGIIFTVLYLYQIFYLVVGLVRKPKKYADTDKSKRYAILIAARNEEKVIANLIKSIKNQDYPSDKLDVYVVADNCTDNTAGISRDCGAIVYERFNKEQVGKGYALNFLLKNIDELCGIKAYDAYFVFDADNILESNYVSEMDKAFSAGSKVVTSYRNSKNYGQSWIASAYALWFIREARFLNNPRSLLGTSGAVSGTGFMVSSEIFEKNNGWKHHLLTEDIEFSVDIVIRGYVIGYCHDAVFYDEQPVTFKQSWTQRLRWAKGFLQVYRHYGFGLFKGMFGKNSFSCFDMTLTILPAFLFTVSNILFNWGSLIYSLIAYGSASYELIYYCFHFIIFSYGVMFILGLITLITERKSILCKTSKAVLHLFMFPVFMISYMPISIVAVFKKVGWKQIHHSVSVSIEDMNKQKNKS